MFSREEGEMYGLIQGELHVEYNTALGIMSRWGLVGVMYVSVLLVYLWEVGDIGVTSGERGFCVE